MVFADIQHGGGTRHSGWVVSSWKLDSSSTNSLSFGMVVQRIQHRQADIAGHHGFFARCRAHRTDHAGHRALAVGAGDGDDSCACRAAAWANSSTSPHRHAARMACWISGSASGHAGADHDAIGPGEIGRAKTRRWTASHPAMRHADAPDWAAQLRLSATRSDAPRRTSQRAMDRPVSPSPSTRIFCPYKFINAVSTSTVQPAPASW